MSGDSVPVTRPLFQMGEGSSILTSPHQFRVVECSREDIQSLLEEVHYSHSINGVISDFCFALVFNGEIWGAALFGRPAMANQWKAYTDDPKKFVELRRLVCTDAAPKNSESFFISKCLKLLRRYKVEKVISYADEEYGHTGIIYRATNFKYLGTTPKGKVIWWEGKKYHDKTVRTKYKGVLKPFAIKVKDALESGHAAFRATKPKHIYLYSL